MLKLKKIFSQIEKNIKSIIFGRTKSSKYLFELLIKQHPADIALFFDSRIENRKQLALFKKFPEKIAIKVFEELSENSRAYLLAHLDKDEISEILKKIPTESLIELFEYLSDDDLKKYLKLLQQKQRSKIISGLNFKEDSAGRIMNTDFLSFDKDFTVKKCISILQRLGEKKELVKVIYVTDSNNKLIGHITLGDLVVNKPETLLKNILDANVLVLNVNQDQEYVAHQIHHYGLLYAPVVDNNNNFLGVITADDVLDVLEEEASEDVYKMSGLSPSEDEYLQTPIWKVVWQRTPWLVGLLLLQSVSSLILSKYKDVVDTHFIISMFLTMLIGTGGNAGNQSSAVIIRGLATGEISRKNSLRVLFKEFGISIYIALILVVVSFTRVFLFNGDLLSAFTVSLSLFVIIMISMFLGSLLPLLLERLNIDPAHSAAPFLATLMDILGVTIYCFIVSHILG